MLINISRVCKSFGAAEILKNVTFQLDRGDRVGVVGENGTGKTTFLNIVSGILAPDDGTVAVKRGLRVGYVAQLAPAPENITVRDFVRLGDERIIELETRLQAIEEGAAHDPHELDTLLHRYDVLGGYRYDARVSGILQGLGIHHIEARQASEISGGELRRVMLARVFASHSDVLLLDEPTNHLDVYAVDWLEQFLRDTDSATVIVSHDRYLLDKAVNRIVAFNNGKQLNFTGNFSAYEKQREAMEEQNRKKYLEQKQFRDKEMDFIRRNMAGQKTKQAQSRLKRLEKMEWTQRDLFRFRRFKLSFTATGRRNKELVHLKSLSVGYGTPVLTGLDRLIRRGDRIGIIGRNGSGKSTLLKTVAGQVPPVSGELRLAENLKVGYFDQDVQLPVPGGTVSEQVLAADPSFRNEDLASYLARFYFFGDDLDKPVSMLSGGERSRLKTAVLMKQPCDLLVLDEPTNHLDLQLKDAVMDALISFDGSLLVVSHDRFFLDRVVNEVIALEGGRAAFFAGSVSAFLERRKHPGDEAPAMSREKGKGAENPALPAEKQALSRPVSKNELKRARWRLDEVEKEIETLENEHRELAERLENPEIYRNVEQLKTVQERLKEVTAGLERLMSEWEDLQELCM
ncbi:MAG: ABC-F family ATP-binding cassette domain-containing protein [Acidobacteria bacterium]|nr:ABC-F family ATP-binding cassette domain-containing protein [Acidobacteriota bacterium]